MLKYCIIILFFFPGELFARNPPVHESCTPVVTITESKNNICIGTAVTLQAAVTNDGTNGVYKWKKNNTDAGAANNASYTDANFRDGDVITCEYSCTTSCGTVEMVLSNVITMHVINDITPIIAVANNDSLICEGEPTLFTTQAYYGNAIPTYYWTVNGSPVGSNRPDYLTDSLTNGSTIICKLTITVPGCPLTLAYSISQLTIYVYPMIHPAIKITPSATDICRGQPVIFTATANGGPYPTFVWMVNNIPTGDVGPSLTTSTLKDGDSVSCIMTIDQTSPCHTGRSATSNKVGVHVRDYINPTLTISAPVLDACAGTPLTFTATAQNAGDYTRYQWYVSGHIAGNNSSTFISNEFANGDKVSCTLTTDIPGCSITASALSNYEVVAVKDIPVITFAPPELSVILGDTAQLNASVSGNLASFTWQPLGALVTPQSLTPSTIPIAHDIVFNLTATDANGCTASNDILVKVLYKLFMPSAFTPNQDGKNDLFRIPPRTSIGLQQFLVYDRWGNIVFRTTDVAQGWNGRYQGKDLDPGTFVYIIKGTFQGKDITLAGTVILLR